MIGRLARVALPAALLGLAIAALLLASPAPPLAPGMPPAEQLAFERFVFDDQGISVLVRAGAGGPVRVAQVQVDGAFWEFAQDPLGSLPRSSAGWLRIPYPWVFGEGHAIAVVTSRGSVFEQRTPLALPIVMPVDLRPIGLVAAVVGVLPVLLAGAVLPALGSFRRAGGNLAYAGTVALLLVLFVATIRLAVASAAVTTFAYQGGGLVWLAAVGFAAGLVFVGRLGRAWRVAGPRAALLAVAGVGAHRFCQGLALGAALAIGAVTLASGLAVGFALHNLLAGVAFHRTLAANAASRPARLALLASVGLAPLAGAYLGCHAAAPPWAPIALAAGAGAVLQVAAGAVRLLAHRIFMRDAAIAGGLLAAGPVVSLALQFAA